MQNMTNSSSPACSYIAKEVVIAGGGRIHSTSSLVSIGGFV